jgi:hypothetical protein
MAHNEPGSLHPADQSLICIWETAVRIDAPGETYTFAGLLGEIGIYNRALSVSEIQAVCTEQNNGEQLPPPTSAPGINGIYRNGFNE